jgi:hypothetical protein
MPNPYMERMANLQQYQQSLQPQQQVIGITGKVVESIDMVRATDIPMNGETVYFPKADGTEIYTKRWLPNGTTEVIAYKPVLNTQEEQVTNTIGIDEKLITSHFKGYMDEVIKRLDGIDARLDNFEQSPARTKSKTAKEES